MVNKCANVELTTFTTELYKKRVCGRWPVEGDPARLSSTHLMLQI